MAVTRPVCNDSAPTVRITYGDTAQPYFERVEQRTDACALMPTYREQVVFYDGLGRQIQSRSTTDSGSGSIVSDVRYDALGRIVQSGVPHAVIEVGADAYTYDANGNMVTRTESGRTYNQAWNALNKLQSVTWQAEGAPCNAEFVYDGDGNRLLKVDHMLNQFDPDTPVEMVTVYIGAIYEQQVNTSKNPLGTPVQGTTPEGVDPIMACLNLGDSPTDFGFTGQRSDSDFGLMDYNARYYSPRLGRFVNPDSIVPESTRSIPISAAGPCQHAPAGTTCSFDARSWVSDGGTFTEVIIAYGRWWRYTGIATTDTPAADNGTLLTDSTRFDAPGGPCAYAPPGELCRIDSYALWPSGVDVIESVTAYGRYWNFTLTGGVRANATVTALAGNGSQLTTIARYNSGPCVGVGSANCVFDGRDLGDYFDDGRTIEIIFAHGKWYGYDVSNGSAALAGSGQSIASITRYRNGACGGVNDTRCALGSYALGTLSVPTESLFASTDRVNPVSPTSANSGCSASSGVWQNSCAAPRFTWSGASDADSGLAGYQLYWGDSSSGTPATSVESTTYNPTPAGQTVATLNGDARTLCTDPMFTMRPHPCSFMLGQTYLVSRKGAVSITAISASQVSSGNSSMGSMC